MQKIWFDRRKLLKRESNIELLRIISMFFILFGHGLQHGFMSLNDINIYEEEIITFLKWTLIWHVNAFLLITGYFGIRFSIRSILSLCINVLFYYIFLCVIIPIYQKEILDIHKIILSPILLIKQGCGWWFIKDYIFLFFLSPVLNLVKDTTNRQYVSIVLSMTFLNVICGFFLKPILILQAFVYNTFATCIF